MDHIPIVVIGHVVAFADSDSLVMFSCCNKWLRYCVSQQNTLWHQQYKQYYNLDDDNEIKWLAWYVKTVRVSKLLASQTKKAINITQLSNQYIEWFYAFCYRRANDANWLKDTPYPVKDLMKKEPDNTYAILLQRIAYHHLDLRRCFIAEQCQSIGEAFTRRFWRLRKLFLNDVHYKFNTKQFLISDKFVVTINGQTNSTNLIHKKPCTISIWPVHQLLFMRPRQFSCLCDNASIRGRWMMINYLEPVAENTNNSNVLRNTRIFDLANGQMCMGTITTYQGETFLLRVNEESATIFSRSLHHSDTTTTLKWNVWEFSNCHLGYGPRCLMQGEIRFKKSNDSAILVRKLDDNLVLIENSSIFTFNMLDKNREDEISLAMISTKFSCSNVCIKDAKPIWTRRDGLYGIVPLFGSKNILVISAKKWTVHSIIDGTILAHIDLKTLGSVLEPRSYRDSNRYTMRFSLYIGRFLIYNSKYNDTFIAVDSTHLNRTRNLGIANSRYLHKELFKYPGIIEKFKSLAKRPLLLNDTFNIRNAMLIENGKDYKIIDMSF